MNYIGVLASRNLCVLQRNLEALEIGLLTGQNGQRLCNLPFKVFLYLIIMLGSSCFVLCWVLMSRVNKRCAMTTLVPSGFRRLTVDYLNCDAAWHELSHEKFSKAASPFPRGQREV